MVLCQRKEKNNPEENTHVCISGWHLIPQNLDVKFLFNVLVRVEQTFSYRYPRFFLFFFHRQPLFVVLRKVVSPLGQSRMVCFPSRSAPLQDAPYMVNDVEFGDPDPVYGIFHFSSKSSFKQAPKCFFFLFYGKYLVFSLNMTVFWWNKSDNPRFSGVAMWLFGAFTLTVSGSSPPASSRAGSK